MIVVVSGGENEFGEPGENESVFVVYEFGVKREEAYDDLSGTCGYLLITLAYNWVTLLKYGNNFQMRFFLHFCIANPRDTLFSYQHQHHNLSALSDLHHHNNI